MLLEEFSRKQYLVVGSSSFLNWFLALLNLYPLVGHTHILQARDMPTAHNRFQCNVHLIDRSDCFVANNQKEPTRAAHFFSIEFVIEVHTDINQNCLIAHCWGRRVCATSTPPFTQRQGLVLGRSFSLEIEHKRPR